MKFISSQLSFFFQSGKTKRNVKLLLKFVLVLMALITAYSIVFHFIMEYEGKSHSWVTGFYWTLTVMSTLGFGDITFDSDLGRIFSIIVLISGIIFLLVLLPFTFIQFFYAPWIEAQSKSRAPRELPESTSGHIILISFDPVTEALSKKLTAYKRDYIIIIEELTKALELYDAGYKVAVGLLDDPETYRRMRVERAALVAAVGNDEINTNIVTTVRELSDSVPVVTNANSNDSLDILQLAGSTHVLFLKKMLGLSLARRAIIGGAKSNVIGQIEELLIAEAPAAGTPLVGKTIREARLRETIGVNVIGIWERGIFRLPGPDTLIHNTTVLALAGTENHLNFYDELFCIYRFSSSPVIILGGGSVGKSAAEYFDKYEIDYLIIEKSQSARLPKGKFVIGNAADYETLKKAGIDKAPSIIVTTRDDATNIFLTIYFRKLRSDIHIISRANLDRNISTLHRSGADLVMSYASLGANAIFNLLQKSEVLMLAEGLDVFRLNVPQSLTGKNLIESQIREKTQCSVIAIKSNGIMNINPDPQIPLEEGNEIVLIGTAESEKLFMKIFAD